MAFDILDFRIIHILIVVCAMLVTVKNKGNYVLNAINETEREGSMSK